MSKLAQSAPLASLNAFSMSDHEVQKHINERIIPRPGARRRRMGLQALVILSRLELMIAKESAMEAGSKNKAALSADISKATMSLESLLAEDGRSESQLRTFIQESSLTPMFPKTAKMLGDTALTSNKDIQAHFTQMSVFNQLISLSLQLQHDLKLRNHKYLAYQIALLYQCVNQVGSGFGKYKSHVEQHFDEVKAIANGAESPILPADLQDWLCTLTSDIVSEALFTGRPFAHQTQFFSEFMNKIGVVEGGL
jgi:hypothetical protein